MTERNGPIESRAWPAALEAFAVEETNGGPRLHGFDVESDLAKNYRFSDLVYLGLSGELPNDTQSRAFEIALAFLVPMSVADGPGHAAALTGFFGAPPSGVLTTAAVTISDYCADAVAAFGALDHASELPAAFQSSTDEERASVDRLRALVEHLFEIPLLSCTPKRDVAILAVLRACGLTTALQLTAAVTIARMPAAIAEAAPRRPNDLVQKYPLVTPPFLYEE